MNLTIILLNMLLLGAILAIIKINNTLWKPKSAISKQVQNKDYLELHELPQTPLNRIRSPNLKDNASNVETYSQQPNLILRALKAFGGWLIKVLKKAGENYKANMALKAQEDRKLSKGKDKMKKGYLSQVMENYNRETSMNFNVSQHDVIGNFNLNPNVTKIKHKQEINENPFGDLDNMFRIGGK